MRKRRTGRNKQWPIALSSKSSSFSRIVKPLFLQWSISALSFLQCRMTWTTHSDRNTYIHHIWLLGHPLRIFFHVYLLIILTHYDVISSATLIGQISAIYGKAQCLSTHFWSSDLGVITSICRPNEALQMNYFEFIHLLLVVRVWRFKGLSCTHRFTECPAHNPLLDYSFPSWMPFIIHSIIDSIID